MAKVVLLIYLLTGCSSSIYYESPEQEHLERLHTSSDTKDGVNKPNLMLFKSPDLTEVRRAPAAVERADYSSQDLEVVNLSNKHLYFLALYDQYTALAKWSKYERELKHCPQFHHFLIDHKTKGITDKKLKLTFHTSHTKSADLVALYPVLALPYKGKELYSHVDNNEQMDREIRQAAAEYSQVLETELTQLCENGGSDNYFIYENLIIHARKDQNFMHSYAGLKALLKIPTFSNLMILESIKNNDTLRLEQLSAVEEEMLERVSGNVVKKYLYKIAQLRNNQSKISRLGD